MSWIFLQHQFEKDTVEKGWEEQEQLFLTFQLKVPLLLYLVLCEARLALTFSTKIPRCPHSFSPRMLMTTLALQRSCSLVGWGVWTQFISNLVFVDFFPFLSC